ncbi:PAAR domain-containing protein [Pseudomonas sp. DTU_2021_1001937_2_SI_NGA_ILE_001]|uniref:PAAR domain-containing protein n=1 Tax=Pseudomonas sp. DTU_2021_1001937_2_SI_NGA_ILE_001 TaxID=3077589 RepID=UPI0025D0F5A0|nr:PAAR domain-containing protein [Pseudomonas sp. DTU_2021_1001937_2_SI_NGA_ILE_001]WNW13032.1 PAAR domain-containing protein [Pseudomonas sp. DTU_2021_1001937_2_SI_NGA_ILE_001]
MPFVVREGDPTTSGGFVLAGSASEAIDLFRIARMGDPVWCPACREVGYIAQGNPTWVDGQVAVATHGHRISCGCKAGSNSVKASQQQFKADMEATIDIPADMAENARAQAERLTREIKEGCYPQRVMRTMTTS